MHPYHHARTHPDKPAYIMAGSGETVTYRQLDEQSNRIAQLFRSLGLQAGDHVAIFLENNPRFFEICWGAQRSGLVYTAISSRLTAAEVDYIVTDCGARLFVTSEALADKAAELVPLMKGAPHRFMIGGTIPGYDSWEEAVARFPATPIVDETAGHDMLYSSGTTGRPKGVMPVVEKQPIDFDNPLLAVSRRLYGIDRDTVYLSPAPLYHAAPLRFNMSVMRLGGTSVIMEHFDAEEYLSLIPRHRITHTQVVPTMFVRFLKLPEEVRAKYDVSSLKCAIHAAAPCPIPTKEAMIDWWGSDHPRILRRHRGAGLHRLQRAGVAGAQGHGGTRPPGRTARARRRHEAAAHRHGRDPVVQDRDVPFEYFNDPAKTREVALRGRAR
jgi:long-chain acyl-CoA synthetase